MTIVDIDPTSRRALEAERGTARVPPTSNTVVPRPDAPAKVRILATADRLFYEEGIRTVGIDRLISESGVTKATFYKHWGSKDRLILQYLQGRHETEQSFLAALIESNDRPTAVIDAITEAIADELDRPGYRGCPFINAAAEYSDSLSDARKLVSMHRDWYTNTLMQLLRDAGHQLPGDGADELLLARDGAMIGGYAGDPVSAAAALRRTVKRVIAGL